MKKIVSVLLLAIVTSFIARAQGELNTAIEFYIAKNDIAKQVVVTSVFTVKMMDGKSLTSINADVKTKLMETLKLSTIIKDGQEVQWNLSSQAVTPEGEFFSDEKEATTRADKMKADLKKKGYSITDYPFKYE
ncbi:MAG: hypothetical protein WCO54_12280 [Bacteroidota bacterium]